MSFQSGCRLDLTGAGESCSLTSLTSQCLLLASDLSYLPCGPLHRAAWVSSWHVAGFPRAGNSRETMEEATMPFKTWPQKSHTIFLLYLSGCTGQPYLVWEDTTQRCEYQMRILGALLEVGYDTCQIPHISFNSLIWYYPHQWFIQNMSTKILSLFHLK